MTLRSAVEQGDVAFERIYMAACKADPRMIAYSEVTDWEGADLLVRTVVEKHLLQLVVAKPGVNLFPSRYSGEPINVESVAPRGFRERHDKPVVEALEQMVGEGVTNEQIRQLGDLLAYKYLTAAPRRPALYAVLIFTAGGRRNALATVCDLSPEKSEAFFDEQKNRFMTATLANTISQTSITKAALFPALDEEGKEIADLWVYTRSAAKAWWKAVECERQHSPAKEIKGLMGLIAKQATDSVPPSFFADLQEALRSETQLDTEVVADVVEEISQMPIDREAFRADWEAAYGDLTYRPSYEKMYQEGQTSVKLESGPIAVSCQPGDLSRFRQVLLGKQSYLVIAIPEQIKLKVGKEQQISVQTASRQELDRWMTAEQP